MRSFKPYLCSSHPIHVIDARVIINFERGQKVPSYLVANHDTIYSVTPQGEDDDLLCSLMEFHQDLPLNPEILSMHFDGILGSLSVCLKDGTFITLQIDGKNVRQSEVTSTGIEVDVVSWSPDGENIIVAKSSSLSILCSLGYGVLKKIDLEDMSDTGLDLVNVGWGKKETQFHGLEGKAAAKGSAVTVDPEDVCDTHEVFISWRGDATMFAVSFWNLQTSRREIKIFEKSGALLSVNEDLPGLDGPISWKPAGDLIAFSQKLPNKYVIGFLEKNGLKHYDFSISSNYKVKNISWNSFSTLLALYVEDKLESKHYLLLWSRGNYHWYQKQKIIFDSPMVCSLWDEISANLTRGVCKNGSFFSLDWTYTVLQTKHWFRPSCKSYVAVTDDDKVLLTSFEEALIPPPMCLWTVKSPDSVSNVIFPSWLESSTTSDQSEVPFMCVVLFDSRVLVYYSDYKNPPVLKKELNMPALFASESPIPLSLSHWYWYSPESILLCYNTDHSISVIHHLEISDGSFAIKHAVHLEFPVVSVNGFGSFVILQCSKGGLYRYDTNNPLLGAQVYLTLPEPCYSTEYDGIDFYSLSETNRLYVNAEQIAREVNSFFLHKDFLLATTSQHTLVVLKKKDEKFVEVSTRKLERGSRLVAVTDNTVILQLPRGNLEAIQPRALTLKTTGRLLAARKYKEAVSLLRKQRVDLNICVDHNPQEFLDDLAEFVRQLDPQWLTLFITELNDNDITKGAYSEFYDEVSERVSLPCKVSTVCSNLRKAMLDTDKESYTLPILSTLVKTKGMNEAFRLANTEQAFQHLMFLVDVDQLYNEALAVYNLEAALKVAGKSQKDPKEYIPFLNSLREMDSNYMKYKIDRMLNKPESALRNIAKCESDECFDECIQLIKEFNLYSLALRLFNLNETRYKVIAGVYGDFLKAQKQYEEAGIMYKRSGELKKAIEPYLKVGDWRECIHLADECGYSDTEKESLVLTLRGVLKSTHKFREAASLYIEVLNNPQHAVELLTLGKLWKEALFLCKSKGYKNLIDSVVKKSIIEHSEQLQDDIKNQMKNFDKYFNRLKVVRTEKENKIVLTELAEPWDTQSETSSVSSFRTGQTASSRSTSSKNTRKANRKLWSLKEGNPREEQALVFSLSETVQNVEKMTGEVRSTCYSMLSLKCDEKAAQLQEVLKESLQHIQCCKTVIWPRDPDADEISLLDEQLKHPPASCCQSDWILKSLE